MKTYSKPLNDSWKSKMKPPELEHKRRTEGKNKREGSTEVDRFAFIALMFFATSLSGGVE